jgi:hypothetical protein
VSQRQGRQTLGKKVVARQTELERESYRDRRHEVAPKQARFDDPRIEAQQDVRAIINAV